MRLLEARHVAAMRRWAGTIVSFMPTLLLPTRNRSLASVSQQFNSRNYRTPKRMAKSRRRFRIWLKETFKGLEAKIKSKHVKGMSWETTTVMLLTSYQ